ncbi:MAG: hypothetical protein AAF985_15490, partial [Bacteroidota bacterium]
PDLGDAANTSEIKSKIELGSSGHEESFDAITKIAGEGARWKAVRNQAAKGELSNLTKFFTRKGEGKDKMRFVYFMDLWKSWATSFNSDYNIDNQAIIDGLEKDTLKKMAGGKATKSIVQTGKDKSILTANKDFDLDNDRPYDDKF